MKLTEACKDILDQLSAVVRDIKEEDFRKEVATLNNSTIGQHIRHTLEFFICLMNNSAGGVINYDNREHDHVIETDKKVAQAVIDDLISFFSSTTSNMPLKLAANYSLTDDCIEYIPTNFHRELAYNIEHAIHHMAIIKIGIKEVASYIKLPAHFGIAISTIKFQESALSLPERA